MAYMIFGNEAKQLARAFDDKAGISSTSPLTYLSYIDFCEEEENLSSGGK